MTRAGEGGGGAGGPTLLFHDFHLPTAITFQSPEYGHVLAPSALKFLKPTGREQ